MTEAKTATKPTVKAEAEPKSRPKASGKAPAKSADSAAPVAKKAPAKTPKADEKKIFAVFAAGGKQYRVSPGDSVKIEKINDDHKEGDKLAFDNVLLVDDGATEATIGTPFIKGAVVNATLKKISRYKTVDVIKYKQKSRYFKKYGHRQPYFEVTIDSIK